MTQFSSFAEILDSFDKLPGFDAVSAEAAKARQDTLTKPPGSLGRLEEAAIFLAGWQKQSAPKLDRIQAIVFAGNHGVCAQGVNPYPQEVTMQMVANFRNGGAAINQLAGVAGADLSVVDLDLETPSDDFTKGAAMSEKETVDAMNRGANSVHLDADLLLLGEMGIGNSTVAAALCAKAFGGETNQWVGPGTGSDSDGINRKIAAIDAGLEQHADASGIEILRRFGGREQAAICGAILAARANHIPVMLDGFICTAAAVPLFAVGPELLAHTMIAHLSSEPGHRLLSEALGKRPLLDLGMRLGEGTGAALAAMVLRGSVACQNGMATFADAGVSDA
jgi:nicotinate-nucleotide--dimethylbenzimidazole phosphoribosyltransferase